MRVERDGDRIKLAMSVGNQIIKVWWDQRVFVELADFIVVSEEIIGKFCACCLLFFSRPDRMQCVWVGNGLLVDTCQTVMAASNEQVKGSSSIRFVFRLWALPLRYCYNNATIHCNYCASVGRRVFALVPNCISSSPFELSYLLLSLIVCRVVAVRYGRQPGLFSCWRNLDCSWRNHRFLSYLSFWFDLYTTSFDLLHLAFVDFWEI